MDVAYYLSELLMQNGEVNVPGLGYFVQLKVDGYYDNTQNKFYPPTSKIQFDQQYDDDRVLLQYIADKKRISLASSKYFTAKFIDNLRQEAMVKEVPLADLGTLHFEDTRLHFKPAEVLPIDPAYYGYQPVEISKLDGTSFHEQLEKEMPRPEPIVSIGTPPVQEQTIEPSVSQEEEFIFSGRGYSDEEVEEKNNNWIWITITAVVLLGIIGVFSLYKFNPAVYNRLIGIQQPAPIILKTPVKHDTTKTITPVIKADSTASSTKKVIADTTAKPMNVNTAAPVITAAPIDTFSRVRYELLGGAFQTIAEANRTIRNYKRLGFEARIVKNAPGRLFKVTLGTYFTTDDAINAMHAIQKTGKISEISIQPYNPKK
ncbi:hypothetical protein [Mucilaginibacter sp. L196]|uniref:HU domain-containing protein n=1 Tax=Mucilaginibacter sp. L196 TaxID=1641870 RepID=UPI00131D5492|nr:hypothetical protein [Mucilaginibacter sp. L196]